MKPRELVGLEDRTPLSEIGGARAVTDRLFSVGSGLYVLTQFGDAENAVRCVAWCPSDAAARRALLLDAKADDGAAGECPAAVGAGLGAAGYAELIDRSGEALGKRVQESAAYEATPAGLFVQVELSARGWTYCFRSRSPLPEDRPYAVVGRLGVLQRFQQSEITR